jgi:addiction module RelB/DinJ family antitoxin
VATHTNTPKDVQVSVRIDRNLKKEADVLFESIGLTMTSAVNVFLRKAVAERAIPFEVSAKNPPLAAGYTRDKLSRAFSLAVESAVAEQRRNGVPVALYDEERKQPYLEMPNGERQYAEE